MSSKILKNSGLLSLGTLLCRVSGLVRVVVLAAFFGTSGVMEAFVVAFRLPNLFRSVLGEGFSDAVAVPVLSEHAGSDKFYKTANSLISLSAFVLVFASILGALLSRPLVVLTAPGFIGRPETFELAVSFTRIFFFYLFFIGLASSRLCPVRFKQFLFPRSILFLNLSFCRGFTFSRSHGYCFSRRGDGQWYIAGSLSRPVLVAVRVSLSAQYQEALHDGRQKGWGGFSCREYYPYALQLNVMIDTIYSSLAGIVGAGALAAVSYASVLIRFLAMVRCRYRESR